MHFLLTLGPYGCWFPLPPNYVTYTTEMGWPLRESAWLPMVYLSHQWLDDPQGCLTLPHWTHHIPKDVQLGATGMSHKRQPVKLPTGCCSSTNPRPEQLPQSPELPPLCPGPHWEMRKTSRNQPHPLLPARSAGSSWDRDLAGNLVRPGAPKDWGAGVRLSQSGEQDCGGLSSSPGMRSSELLLQIKITRIWMRSKRLQSAQAFFWGMGLAPAMGCSPDWSYAVPLRTLPNPFSINSPSVQDNGYPAYNPLPMLQNFKPPHTSSSVQCHLHLMTDLLCFHQI